MKESSTLCGDIACFWLSGCRLTRGFYTFKILLEMSSATISNGEKGYLGLTIALAGAPFGTGVGTAPLVAVLIGTIGIVEDDPAGNVFAAGSVDGVEGVPSILAIAHLGNRFEVAEIGYVTVPVGVYSLAATRVKPVPHVSAIDVATISLSLPLRCPQWGHSSWCMSRASRGVLWSGRQCRTFG
jgi:hypothetical protein